jgi:hypothetical protein
MFFAGGITHVNTNLAVVNLAKPTQPLSLYTYRIVAALFVSRWVKYNYAFILPGAQSKMVSPIGCATGKTISIHHKDNP